jgi:hypothetical protein
MPVPDSDESKRGYWPPPIWSAKPKQPAPSQPDPPIGRYVTLPERVSVEYLAELTGQGVREVMEELCRLRLYFHVHRGVEFEGAAKLLRKYGIGANKAD